MKRQIAKYHWALLLGATLAAVRGDAQTIYRFTDVNDGAYPIATLAVGSNGALYGSASGVVFQLNPPTSPGGAWTENTIYDGGSWAALAVGPNGELYGTTYFGGAQNDGGIFALAPTGRLSGSTPRSLQSGTKEGSLNVRLAPNGASSFARHRSLYCE